MKVSDILSQIRWHPINASLGTMVEKCYHAPDWVVVSRKIIDEIGTSLMRWEADPKRTEHDIHLLVHKLGL